MHICLWKSQILIGNIISDFVKGKKQYDFNSMIQKGIKLHRSIDSFRRSSCNQEMKEVFKPAYGLYAVLTDIVYDYFLANDSNEFTSHQELELFSINSYMHIEKKLAELPTIILIFPYMKQYEIFVRHPWGIQKSFTGLVKRAKCCLEAPDTAYRIFTENLPTIKFTLCWIFPFVKNSCQPYFSAIIKYRLIYLWKKSCFVMKRILFVTLSLIVRYTAVFCQNKIPQPDKSPMDMSYYPDNFPLLKTGKKFS